MRRGTDLSDVMEVDTADSVSDTRDSRGRYDGRKLKHASSFEGPPRTPSKSGGRVGQWRSTCLQIFLCGIVSSHVFAA